jgi:hypothetical protein
MNKHTIFVKTNTMKILLFTPLAAIIVAVAGATLATIAPSLVSGLESLSGISGVVMPLLCYFIPAIFAGSRHHHNTGAIFLMNLLLGWTLFGWVVALIWATTNPALAKVK